MSTTTIHDWEWLKKNKKNIMVMTAGYGMVSGIVLPTWAFFEAIDFFFFFRRFFFSPQDASPVNGRWSYTWFTSRITKWRFFPMILTPHFQMDFQANHVRLSLRTEFEDMGLPENRLSRKTRHVVSHHVPHRNCHWGVWCHVPKGSDMKRLSPKPGSQER